MEMTCLPKPSSSIIDYQHDPSDVVGAALLGTMIALVRRGLLGLGVVRTSPQAAATGVVVHDTYQAP